jgi:ethanolamine utilization protein EutN
MLIAKVIGNATATAKNKCFEGFKLLVVEILDLHGNGSGQEYLAVDTVDAGAGDKVLLCMEGGSVSIVMDKPQSSADAAIVGIIDTINLEKEN